MFVKVNPIRLLIEDYFSLQIISFSDQHFLRSLNVTCTLMNPNRGLALGIGLISTTDLKIDWIWHLLLIIEAGVIGPTLPILVLQNHNFLVFIPFYTLIININGIKTRTM